MYSVLIKFVNSRVQELEDYFNLINDDIRHEIMRRLPAKDLQSLKCVSEEWSNIISDRSFVRSQLNKTETVAGFFFQKKFRFTKIDIKHISYIPLETRNAAEHTNVLSFLSESVVLLSSCNGLICCRSTFPSMNPLIYICNPFNKEWTSSIKWSHPSRTSIALSFDPWQILTGDALPNFKLVAMCQTKDRAGNEGSHFTFDIFSSETGQWRRSKEICRCSDTLLKNKGVFAEGALYWLTNSNQIIMFDPQLEKSFVITRPEPEVELCFIPQMCIGESKGKIHCVLLSEDGFQLWVLKNQFESLWDKTFAISLDELEEEISEIFEDLYKILGN